MPAIHPDQICSDLNLTRLTRTDLLKNLKNFLCYEYALTNFVLISKSPLITSRFSMVYGYPKYVSPYSWSK